MSRAAVIIPALNEVESLRLLLPRLLPMGLGQIIVADNGSNDGTDQAAGEMGVCVIRETNRGYGNACLAGLRALHPDMDVVVFLDADLSDDVTYLDELAAPILEDRADFVLGARTLRREQGSMSAPQIFGNWLATLLVRLLWGYPYEDLAPFRAVRRESLDAMRMRDRTFGWTVEMQVRAVELGLRIEEVSVPYYRRLGKSKISGTVTGVFKAGYGILTTIGLLWLTRRFRRHTRRRTDLKAHE